MNINCRYFETDVQEFNLPGHTEMLYFVAAVFEETDSQVCCYMPNLSIREAVAGGSP